jgi:hypothetical protein
VILRMTPSMYGRTAALPSRVRRLHRGCAVALLAVL